MTLKLPPQSVLSKKDRIYQRDLRQWFEGHREPSVFQDDDQGRMPYEAGYTGRYGWARWPWPVDIDSPSLDAYDGAYLMHVEGWDVDDWGLGEAT